MALHNKEVLLIDDDQDILKLARKILEGAGFSVHCETNINSAFKYLEKNIPHIIFLDLNFDKQVNIGIEFLQNKKNNNAIASIPTVILTAEKNKKTIAYALVSGAKDYLGKPFRAHDLILKAKKLLTEFELPKIDFSEEIKMDCVLDVSITHLNEVSCLFTSSIKFNNNTEIKLNSHLLESLDNNILRFRSVGLSKPRPASQYLTMVTFLGIDEATARKIRILKVY